MSSDDALRTQLAALLGWHDAHATFEDAVKGVPPEVRGTRPDGLPHSPWELLEHLRITQRDILDFSRAPTYHEMKWPDDYWPPSPEPPSEEAWDESAAAFRADLDALKAMAADRNVDLFAPVPNGDGQTYLREILLAADHNAYHVGELVLTRRALGVWP